MNNILTFEDYKKMNIRQVESLIYHQFIDENIINDDELNEGFIRNAINKAASNFIQTALADEIEKGKELEKSIKEALDGLNKGFNEIEKRINTNRERGIESKSNLKAIEKVKEAIKAVQSQAFDTLTMIGSEGEIDFSGFVGSATVSAAVNFGVLFSPIRSLFITRKAYKYFLGIIKQTIRRNLLIIQLNFDQFENLILQKSFETDNDSDRFVKNDAITEIITTISLELCNGKDSKYNFLPDKKSKQLGDYLKNLKQTLELSSKNNRELDRNNPFRSLWEDQHNNTYTRTLEQIKQYINDDSQKELDSLKNSITKMSGNDAELAAYGELLISAAEEYAIKTNQGINNNFIKMSSVFNLENQKKLIELIKKTQEENEAETRKKEKNKILKEEKEKIEKEKETGKKLYEEQLNTDEKYTFDEFNDKFDDSDQKCLRRFFQSEEGKDAYNKWVEKHHLYKYFIFSDIELTDTFFKSIESLKIVKVSDMDDFYNSIVKQEDTLYYMMAEKSIKNAINTTSTSNKKTLDYFGFDISDDDVEKHVLKKEAFVEKNVDNGDGKTIKEKSTVDNIFNNIIKKNHVIKGKFKTTEPKPKYFLTFSNSGDNLFNVLHNDFKTKIFSDDGKKYETNISFENKELITKLIDKELKIGNNISSTLAEYLIRLEAHMLLEEPNKPWFILKNDKEVLKHFNHDTLKNRNAFVEIKQEDYENIEKFLIKCKNEENNENEKNNKPDKTKKD